MDLLKHTVLLLFFTGSLSLVGGNNLILAGKDPPKILFLLTSR